MDNKIKLKNDILNSNQFNWIDNIYINAIPVKNVTDDTNDVLISDINSTLKDWGNNTFSHVDKLIQIQIYFSKKTNINLNESTNQLVRFLVTNGWQVDGYSNFIDPDTKQQAVTIKPHKIF